MPATFSENEQLPLGIEGWPWCAICDKPVEKVINYRCPVKQIEYVAARCHGQLQIIEIDPLMLVAAERGTKISISGKAFDIQLLTTSPEDPAAPHQLK